MSRRPVDEPCFRGGSGESVVLLHGHTATWHVWAPLLGFLTPRYDVFAPTLAGHSGADRQLNPPITQSSLIDALELQLDEAGIPSAHLVGNSGGGFIAMELARRGRARSVMAISPAMGWPVGERRVTRLFHRTHRRLTVLRPVLPLLFKSARVRRQAFRLNLEHGERLTSQQAVSTSLRVLDCSISSELLKDVMAHPAQPFDDPGVPVRIAWAEADRLLPRPRYSEPWKELAPHASWTTMPGVGHVPMLDDPELIGRTVLEWLDQVSMPPRTPPAQPPVDHRVVGRPTQPEGP